MKTLQNLFGKNSALKSINAFEKYSLNANQMNCVKGGTVPVTHAGDSSTTIGDTEVKI